ncbi:MAG: 30S ribosomal protein S4e [Candidatus Bathyarchaeia archaeon]
MGRKGESKHLKRLPSPGFWPIHVKVAKWVVKPSPGPHPRDMCIPLLLIVRDLLGYAKTGREARTIVSQGKIRVDGKVRRDYRYPVGLMDVVEIADLDKTYRILPIEGKGLSLIEIPREEAIYKLCRVEGKTTVKGGHVQLSLHDGRSLLVNVNDPSKPVEDIYKVMDSLKISLPSQDLLSHLKFSEGCYVLITGGANLGKVGRIKRVIKGTATRPPSASIEAKDGYVFQTIMEYTFVIGVEKPEITLPIQVIAS